MKALRNPYVMTVLVALAIVLGYFRFRAPRVVSAPPAAKPARQQIAGPDASMDLDQLGWTPSPSRDPFSAVVHVAPVIGEHEAEPVVDVLDLKAVWLNEGGGWAVINGKVLGEGDLILDFRVEKILADGVLVQGPGGRRQVGFKPASASSRRPVAVAVSPPGKAPLKPAQGKPPAIAQGRTAATGKTPLKPASSTQLTIAQDILAASGRLKSPEKSDP